MKKIAIIPAYNEQDSIVSVMNDLKKNAPDFDTVIINDGSTDNTLAVCLKHGFNVINLTQNSGIGVSVQTGYRYALKNGYEVAVQFDGDGQHQAIYLNKLYDHMIKTKSDMVIGSRYLAKEGFQSSVMRRIGIRFLSRLIQLLYHQRIKDVTSGQRMTNKKVIAFFAENYPHDYPEPETLALCMREKYKVTEVPVKMSSRIEGSSSIGVKQSVYYMVKVSFFILAGFFRRSKETNKFQEE